MNDTHPTSRSENRRELLSRHGVQAQYSMVQQFADEQLEDCIDRLHVAVKSWAEQNDLWHDAVFRRLVKSFNMETGAPAVTTLRASGPLAELVIYPGIGAIHDDQEAQRLSDQCARLIENHGFCGEPSDETRLDIFPLERSDPVIFGQFKEYMRWKWICSLIRGDFDALNSELYEYFGNHSHQFTRLHWREFEKLVAELLQAHGFRVELGSGSADGGVDIRLVQRDPIGDILTLVQVKKYREDRPIELQAVQALHGAKEAERADGSMFVTTSDYRPAARRFAGRENVRMGLHLSADVQKWCDDASAGIIEDKARITTEREVIRALNHARRNPKTIVHASCGYTMRYNRFSLVLKESAGSGLVLDLPSRIVQHDGYEQSGTEIPDLSDNRKVLRAMNTVRRLRKLPLDSHFRFSDIDAEREFYTTWNQKPAEFYGD